MNLGDDFERVSGELRFFDDGLAIKGFSVFAQRHSGFAVGFGFVGVSKLKAHERLSSVDEVTVKFEGMETFLFEV